jgi:hypothetical protein
MPVVADKKKQAEADRNSMAIDLPSSAWTVIGIYFVPINSLTEKKLEFIIKKYKSWFHKRAIAYCALERTIN